MYFCFSHDHLRFAFTWTSSISTMAVRRTAIGSCTCSPCPCLQHAPPYNDLYHALNPTAPPPPTPSFTSYTFNSFSFRSPVTKSLPPNCYFYPCPLRKRGSTDGHFHHLFLFLFLHTSSFLFLPGRKKLKFCSYPTEKSSSFCFC